VLASRRVMLQTLALPVDSRAAAQLASIAEPSLPLDACPCGMQMGGHGMMGGMWFGMVLLTLLIVAVIAALNALTVYLVRHSRQAGSPRTS
jgi:hypothetical protein